VSDLIGFFYRVPQPTRPFPARALIDGTVDRGLQLAYKAGFRDSLYAGVLLVLVVVILGLIARRPRRETP
jgi:hypothetical protein